MRCNQCGSCHRRLKLAHWISTFALNLKSICEAIVRWWLLFKSNWHSAVQCSAQTQYCKFQSRAVFFLHWLNANGKRNLLVSCQFVFFSPPPMCLNQIKICYLLIKKSGKKVNWVQRNESKQWKRNTRYMTFASDETASVAVIARHSIKYTALKRLESLIFFIHTFFASFTPLSSCGKRKSR